MEYGQIAESAAINDFIYRCFESLLKENQRKFVKKFREQPHNQNQVMHTLAELVCGAYLSSQGYRIACDYNLDGETPDWCILNDAGLPLVVIEVANFRVDQITESNIEQQKQAKGYAVYRRDENTKNKDRLYESIKKKAVSYRDLVNKLALPYVIAVRPDYRALVDFEEVSECLATNDEGLFDLYRHLSGVIYFEENGGKYIFRYIGNPNCLRVTALPDGFYP